MDRLALALAQARRKTETLAVIFLALDRFEVAGSTDGDDLLQSAGERLWGLIREGDTVARVGGNEFAILLSGISEVEGAVAVSRRILEDFRRPWVLDGHEFHLSTSIGIAICPDDGEDAETLLKNAAAAMCRAKEQGRDDFQLYTPAMHGAALERLALESGLRRALERDEFVLHYQPQVNISSGRIVGMEALVRWQHPDRALVSPMEFIPAAEETGLILPLGEGVLRTACIQNKAWQEAGLPSMRVAVNLSARQFQSRGLVNTVTKTLEETGLAPDRLQLEITEGAAMQDTEFTARALHDLKMIGVQIVIDDFGTGHSSLSFLARFPINALKIDQSFVAGLPMDQSAAAITTAIITLAHSLSLTVIAEGVETEGQLAFLKERKCDEFQGYLFSKPKVAGS